MSKIIGLSDFEGHNLQKSYVNNDIEKATTGEGSRGGKVIGHTKSGKPIYQDSGGRLNHFKSVEEHEDAIQAHQSERKKIVEGNGDPKMDMYHYRHIQAHIEAKNELKRKDHKSTGAKEHDKESSSKKSTKRDDGTFEMEGKESGSKYYSVYGESQEDFEHRVNNDLPYSSKRKDIEKALSILDQSVELIEKASHKAHKYLRIENGRYIYDEKEMTANEPSKEINHPEHGKMQYTHSVGDSKNKNKDHYYRSEDQKHVVKVSSDDKHNYSSNKEAFSEQVDRARKVHDDPNTSKEDKDKAKSFLDGGKEHNKKFEDKNT